MNYKKILSNKFVFFLLIIVLASLGGLKYKQWQHQRAIDAEKQSLIEQTNKLEQKNQELKDSLAYIGSQDFKEKIARQQLNLKKQDEYVFNFSDNLVNGTSTDDLVVQVKKPNYQKWVEYFLKKD